MILDSNARIANFYVVCSCTYLPLLTAGIFLTNAYLHSGHDIFLPIYFLFIFAELLKYGYIKVAHQKELSYNPKQKFKLISIILILVKQIKIGELFKSLFMLLSSTIVFSIVAILFGAELLDNHKETLMFGSLITVLIIFPSCLHFGVKSILYLLHGVKPNDHFSQVLYRNIQFTLFGAWLGAFVLPLDWDRDWQVWPIPCSSGAILGYLISHFVSLVTLFIKLNDKSSVKSGNKIR